MAATALSQRPSLPSSARTGFRMTSSNALGGTFVVGASSLMADASSMPLTIVAPPTALRCSSSAISTSRRGSTTTAKNLRSVLHHHPKPPEYRSSNVESRSEDAGSNHTGDHQFDLVNSVRLPKLTQNTSSSSAKHSSSDSVLTRTPNKVDSEISSANAESQLKDSPRHVRSVFANFRVLERLATSARLRSAKKSALNHLRGRKSAERKTLTLKQDNSDLPDNTEKLLPHPPTMRKAFDKVDPDSGVSSQESPVDVQGVEDSSYGGAFIVGSGAVDSVSSTPQKSKRVKKKRPVSVKIKVKRRSHSRRAKCSTPITSTINLIGNVAGSLSPMMVVEPAKVEIYSSRFNKNKKRTDQKNSSGGVPQGSRSWSNNDGSDGGVTLRKSLETYGPVTLRTFEHANTVYGTMTTTIKVSPTWTSKKKGTTENKVTKIYLSEKQSSSIRDCGKLVPCAPPVTPMPEMFTNVEYIPSLSDLRSQRAIKNRLVTMEKEAKERRQKRVEEAKKMEKQLQRDHVALKKHRQRQEIYALNKVMTELELNNFHEFCKKMNNVTNTEKNS